MGGDSYWICAREKQKVNVNFFKDGKLFDQSTNGNGLSKIYGSVTSFIKDSKEMYKYGTRISSSITTRPIFDNELDAWNYLYGQQQDDTEKVKAPIWVSPEIQDTYKNAGKLEFPENAPQSINVPNIDQLAQLAQQLQNASSLDAGSQTDAANSAMQKYLASLQTKTNRIRGHLLNLNQILNLVLHLHQISRFGRHRV